MAYIVKNKLTGRYLVRGKESDYEIYWSKEPRDAMQFSTRTEAADYIQQIGCLWRTKIVEAEQLPASTVEPMTLGDLPEGKKFKYATGSMTLMKASQMIKKFSFSDDDIRYYLPGNLNKCMVVIIESPDAPSLIGRIILLNSSVLVREVQ